jgi:hypothetical protein
VRRPTEAGVGSGSTTCFARSTPSVGSVLLEAAGAYAPGLEQEARQTRRRLAELVR